MMSMLPHYVRGDTMIEGIRVIRSLCLDAKYAIYRVEGDRDALVTSTQVVNQWLSQTSLSERFVQEHFFEMNDIMIYITEPGYYLFTPVGGPFPQNFEEAENFALSLKHFAETQKLFHYPNLLFIEQYGFILPLPSSNDHMHSVDEIIGMMLTDGLPINASDVDKIKTFCDWLPDDSLIKVINEAGVVLKPTDGETAQNFNQVEQRASVYSSHKYLKPFILKGRTKLTQIFNDQIVDFFQRQSAYQRMGITTVPAFLLYGPPGSGKTYAVNQLASYLGFPVYSIDSSSVASPYIHDTSKKIGDVFRAAMEHAPSILIIDEIEAYVGKRGIGNEGHHIEEVDEFLRNIPLAVEYQVIIFGMTNHLEMIDPAVLRKGRFDQILEVGMPSQYEIEEVLKNQMKELPLADDINIEDISKKLEGHPLSDVAYVIRECGRMAVRNNSDVITNKIVSDVLANVVNTNTSESNNTHTIGF